MIFLNLFLINLLSSSAERNSAANSGYCDATKKICKTEAPETKLIFYDVNPPEGFNLRRDVYMRFAIMLSDARNRGKVDWQLVLPPWSQIYHWRSKTSKSKPQFWDSFFDVNSLKSFAPVVEQHEVMSKSDLSLLEIDTMYVLENFDNPFENGVFEEKWQLTKDCEYEGNYWGYNNITAKEVVCVKFQGKISKLWELIFLHPSDKKVMFTHGEIPLHDNYGTKTYWDCRKSMKFSPKLINAAKHFISEKLNCFDEKCSTYLSVHWRRKDFAYNRPNDVPSIAGTVKQVDVAIKKHFPNIKKVFIATDASAIELKVLEEQLQDLTYEVYFYVPTETEFEDFTEGGVAIIDQIICAHSAYFIGTHESTFSFRIQEEREILGMESNTTFNRFCPDSGPCDKPSKWSLIE